MATVQAVVGGDTVGSVDVNLADYVRPDMYLKQMTLKDVSNGVSPKSFVTIEIKTKDAK